MAKKYKHICRTDQNTSECTQTNYRKDLMSAKKNNIRAIIVEFSPSRYEVDKTGDVSTKKLQNHSVGCQITSEIQLQQFL